MDIILKTCFNELGEKEITGPKHNATIVNYAKETGFEWINDDETPWCSIFANWIAKKCGFQGTDKANARSWLLIGQKVDDEPEPGDIVIFWRESPASWKGHVGFFLGFSKNSERVYCLGGNQGNQVSVSAYPTHTVLGFRRLSTSNLTTVPDQILKKNDTGNAVKCLQDALKLAGFNCGTSDGSFGIFTRQAIENLQATSGHLKVDGIFGKNTRDYLLEILQH